MEIESSIIAAQNALAINPPNREPQQQAQAQNQQNQRRDTELPRSQVVARQNSPDAFERAERFRQQQQPFSEQPNGRAQQAINAYQSLANQQQRVEIQQMLGIDTFA